jgi:hypothetical protein
MRNFCFFFSENRIVVLTVRWQALFAAFLSISLLVSCAANTPLVEENLNSQLPLTVVRYNTPEMKSMGMGKALTVALLSGGIGLAVAIEASGETTPLDFCKLVMDKFVQRIPQDYPQWPNMSVEDRPIVEAQKIPLPRLEFKVTNLGIGWIGRDGFTSTTIVDMIGPDNLTLWKKEFTYFSVDFKRKATIDEFLAENGRLLLQEMDFAADRTVENFVTHLKGQRADNVVQTNSQKKANQNLSIDTAKITQQQLVKDKTRLDDSDIKSTIENKILPSSDPNIISVSLLNRTYHMGDNNISQYENSKPDGIEFKNTFLIPTDFSETSLAISVSDIVPNKHKEFLRGSYKSRLYINNTEVAVLNNFIEGTEDKLTIEEIYIDIPKNLLKIGNNEIKVVAGYRQDKNNYDDFQIHKVELKYKKPN